MLLFLFLANVGKVNFADYGTFYKLLQSFDLLRFGWLFGCAAHLVSHHREPQYQATGWLST